MPIQTYQTVTPLKRTDGLHNLFSKHIHCTHHDMYMNINHFNAINGGIID